jgi:hypothetical protein
VEEKILQRQLSKEGLTTVVEDREATNTFSTDELKTLFMRRKDTISDTHDALRCKRCRSVKKYEMKKTTALSAWQEGELLEFMDDFLKELKTRTDVAEVLVEAPALLFVRTALQAQHDGTATSKSPICQSLPLFSRALRQAVKEIDQEEPLVKAGLTVTNEFMSRWSDLVPQLQRGESATAGNGESCTEAQGAGKSSEESDECVIQEGCPDEDDFNRWSHHCSVNSTDDEALKRAMGDDNTVSFVFGLEINWDLLQVREAERKDAEGIRKERAKKELEELNRRRALKRNMTSSVEDLDDTEAEPDGVNGTTAGADVLNAEKNGKGNAIQKTAGTKASKETKKKKKFVVDDNDDDDSSVDIFITSETNGRMKIAGQVKDKEEEVVEVMEGVDTAKEDDEPGEAMHVAAEECKKDEPETKAEREERRRRKKEKNALKAALKDQKKQARKQARREEKVAVATDASGTDIDDDETHNVPKQARREEKVPRPPAPSSPPTSAPKSSGGRISRSTTASHPDEWTAIQLVALESAYSNTSTKKANLWNIISGHVAGKTAEACEARWRLNHAVREKTAFSPTHNDGTVCSLQTSSGSMSSITASTVESVPEPEPEPEPEREHEPDPEPAAEEVEKALPRMVPRTVPRMVKELASSQDSSQDRAARVARKWQCFCCSFENPIRRSNCEMCTTKRPRETRHKGTSAHSGRKCEKENTPHQQVSSK